MPDRTKRERGRKRAEAALRESEEKYRTVFENTGTATVIIEESTTISLANKEFLKLSGCSKEELEGKKSWTEFVVKEDLQRMMKYHKMRRRDPDSAPKNYEFRFVDKMGNVKNILLVVDVIPGTKKSVASLLDITERKRVEEEQMKIAAATVEAMVDPVFVLDLEGRCVSTNRAHSQMFGLEPKDLIGKPIMEIRGIEKQKPEEVEKFMPLIREAIEKGRAGPVELVLVAMDGREIPLSVIGGAIKDDQGNPTHIVAVLRDITERKRVEEELKARVKELEEFHEVVVGRELKMKQMEAEFERLKAKLGEK